MPDILDVLIIGAGLSGLQAAVDVHRAGRTLAILESRDRVGGKTRSVKRPDGKGIQELGAAWVNDTNQSHVWEYCKKFGLTPVVQRIEGLVACENEAGQCHFFQFGSLPQFEPTEIDNITSVRDLVEKASLDPASYQQPERARLDSISFEQFCRDAGACPRTLYTARLWTRGTLGQEPCEISALAFLEVARGGLGVVNLRHDGKHGAQHLRLEEGTESISIGMSKILPAGSIHLNTPVISVAQDISEVCTVTTHSGQIFKARKVIVSIPAPAYKNIAFDPPLPRRKQTYLAAARYGYYIKYICLFKSPFWRRQGSCGLAQSFCGPINHCRDTSVDHQSNFALTCFIASTPGRKWACLNDEDRREAILRQLGSLFAVDYEAVKTELIDTMISEWMEDSWAGWGCPVVATPPETIGAGADGELVSEKFGALCFVGTELTDEWRGYMEGALRSGQRGAKQALTDLCESGT